MSEAKDKAELVQTKKAAPAAKKPTTMKAKITPLVNMNLPGSQLEIGKEIELDHKLIDQLEKDPRHTAERPLFKKA